jgi:kynurenine formamidase
MSGATKGGVGISSVPTEQQLDALFESVSNWNRWGSDDEQGALHHLTPARRAAARDCIVDGTSISLAHDLGVSPSAETPYPAEHHMLAAGDARDSDGFPGYEASRDYFGCHVHGLGVSHIDALCHMFWRGRMYNGYPASDVRSTGAIRNTVLSFADGIVGRGVLLDVAAARGVAYLPPARTLITVDDLEATEKRQGLRVEAGDILLVGSGRDAFRKEKGGRLDPAEGMAGLHPACLPWLREREIAVLGSDGISDAVPGLGIPNWPFPIHQIGITSMGLHLLDNLALGRLAEACAARQRWSFFFTLGSIRVPGGTGCPVNPIAVL